MPTQDHLKSLREINKALGNLYEEADYPRKLMMTYDAAVIHVALVGLEMLEARWVVELEARWVVELEGGATE